MGRVAVCLGLIAGCAPPDIPEELLPSIEIVSPRSDSVVALVPGDGACDLVVPVAVDIDNVEIVPRGGEAADGEGHWHLVVEGREEDSLLMVDDGQSATYTVTDFTPGSRITLVASLQDSQHQPIAGDAATSRAEIELAAPPSGTCP